MKKNLDKKQNFIFLGIFILLTLFIYFPAMSFPILKGWDDQEYLLYNADKLKFSAENIWFYLSEPFFGFYHPITMYSYMLDYQFFGLDGKGYHIHNILLHIFTVIGFYFCLLKFGCKSLYAFFIALIFAMHPQRVETVAWLSTRKDLLCAFFYIWGLFFYFHYRGTNKRKAFWFCFFFYLFALLSKPVALSFPFVLYFLIVFKNRTWFNKEDLKVCFVYCIPLILMFPATMIAQMEVRKVEALWNLKDQIHLAFYNYFWYLGKLFSPSNLNPIYPLVHFGKESLGIIFLGLICLISICVFIYKRDRKIFLYTTLPWIFCYIIMLAPVSGLMPLGFLVQADRYCYLPHIALLGLFYFTFKELSANNEKLQETLQDYQKTIFTGLSFIIFLGVFLSSRLVPHWKNVGEIYTTACATKTPNPKALHGYGMELMRKGLHKDSLAISNLILSSYPNSRKGQYLKASNLDVLGYQEKNKKKSLEALQIFQELMKKGDLNAEPWLFIQIADCYRNLEKLKRAIACYSIYLTSVKNDFRAQKYRGLSYYKLKQFNKALIDFEKCLKLNPQDKSLNQIYCNTLDNLNRSKEADKHWAEFIKKTP